MAQGAVGDFVADDTRQLIVGGEQLHEAGGDENLVVLINPRVGDSFANDLDGELPGDVVLGRQRLSQTGKHRRSEEHTSELQSRENLVCRLLLEKKKMM